MKSLLAGVVVVLLCVSQTLAAESSNRPRIGVFKRTDLLIAFYKSAAWDQHLKDLMKQRDQAREKGDKKKVKQIEQQGAKLQQIAHQQLAGQAPLSNIFEQIEKKFPEVCKESGVCAIIEKPIYSTKDVELVDITERLVKLLPPAKKN